MKAFNTGIFGLWEEKKRKEKIKNIGAGVGVGPTERHMLLFVYVHLLHRIKAFENF